MKQIKVLFVCMGNICRSPTAEGVFRHLIQQERHEGWITTDSAGTHAYHIGEQPDRRAQQTALGRGIDISDLRARKASVNDFYEFDYILAMDDDNYRLLSDLCPLEHIDKLSLFLDFSKDYSETQVPDPYYGGDQGFEHVFNLVESASRGLLADIKKRYT
ncbi:MAG: low molecular weight phosphotyrosine protein phosphatase [Gammaproteobacteria bacterium]|nr:low molecular weight phosphotyrosine protein phosphatase [Gammaproteobacteria bacterium]MCW8987817.1 low molecular weight phosphotyrosine protein phosphatase [Gammaproteobacteria bacterium]